MSDLAPIVRLILTETATRVSGIDPELEATLRDMASDYAGPQVSDEDRKQEQR